MLDDIIKRLESVEVMRDTFEEKVNDLESQLDLWVGADMDEAVGSWNELERKRDPSGRLRGVDSGKDGEVVMGQDEGLGAATRGVEDIDAIRREIKGLRHRVETVPASSGISAEDLEAVRAENKRLETLIEAIGANTAPREEIRRLESLLKAKAINDARAADGTSTTLSTISTEIQQSKTSSKALGESRDSQATAHAALSRSVIVLAEEVKTLRTELKAVTDGREQWTKDVMTACLTMVKEELQQEYAKIAKKVSTALPLLFHDMVRKLIRVGDPKLRQRIHCSSQPCCWSRDRSEEDARTKRLSRHAACITPITPTSHPAYPGASRLSACSTTEQYSDYRRGQRLPQYSRRAETRKYHVSHADIYCTTSHFPVTTHTAAGIAIVSTSPADTA